MNAVRLVALVLIGGLVLIGLNSVFIVDERKQALVIRLGQINAVYNTGDTDEAGLKFKLPLVDEVVVYDKRNLLLPLEQVLITAGEAEDSEATAEVLDVEEARIVGGQGSNERLPVDVFARWRIIDPGLFYQRYKSREIGGERVKVYLRSATREVLGGVPASDIISGQRAELMAAIRDQVAKDVLDAESGVEIVDVRLKRVELPRSNREQVFARMVSERRQVAAEFLARGREQAARIEADADAQVRRINAEANEEDRRIRGEGEAQRQAIYIAAYGADAEFFNFYRALEAYDKAFEDGTPLILSPDDEFFRYFVDQNGGR